MPTISDLLAAAAAELAAAKTDLAAARVGLSRAARAMRGRPAKRRPSWARCARPAGRRRVA